MKNIAMIPARMGSQRIHQKNLRLLGGKPLVCHIIEKAIEAKCFNQIFLNSEDIHFKKIAKKYGIGFYHRSKKLASDKTINDEFALDFIQNVPGDILFQLLPTSPFVQVEEIRQFEKQMRLQSLDTLISVVPHQIACVFEFQPINFKKLESHRSSQEMKPIYSYATALMAWKYKSFRKNMKKYASAYHGGDGKTGYFPLRGFSTIDIDHEEDWQLAEAAFLIQQKIKNDSFQHKKTPHLHERNTRQETDVPLILKKDGVIHCDFSHENQPLVNLKKIVQSKNATRSWSHRLINTENNSATLICQMPGEGNRLHYHSDWNEWWYIIQGSWEWEIEGKTIKVNEGDLVFIEKYKWHKITAVGNGPAIRLAVSRDKVAHIYKSDQEY